MNRNKTFTQHCCNVAELCGNAVKTFRITSIRHKICGTMLLDTFKFEHALRQRLQNKFLWLKLKSLLATLGIMDKLIEVKSSRFLQVRIWFQVRLRTTYFNKFDRKKLVDEVSVLNLPSDRFKLMSLVQRNFELFHQIVSIYKRQFQLISLDLHVKLQQNSNNCTHTIAMHIHCIKVGSDEK